MGGNSRGLQKSFDVHAPGSRGLKVVFAARVFGIGVGITEHTASLEGTASMGYTGDS
jgi:hypothetical protein